MNGAPRNLGIAAAVATAVLSPIVVLFYVAQRRGLFGRTLRGVSKVFGKRDWSTLTSRARFDRCRREGAVA